MKFTRNYLTSEELGFIINAMLEKETALEREIVKVGLVTQILAEDLGEFEDCNDVYDKVVADNTIDLNAIVDNYNIIDKIVSEELSVTNVIRDFVKDINEKLDKMGDIDLNGSIAQLKELIEKQEQEKVTPVKGGRKNGGTKKIQ